MTTLQECHAGDMLIIDKIISPELKNYLFNYFIFENQSIQVTQINFDKQTIAIIASQQTIALRMKDAAFIEVKHA